jgi:hypothetical protein
VREKPSGAKARQFIAEHRRHKCLLHPVKVYIHAENALIGVVYSFSFQAGNPTL